MRPIHVMIVDDHSGIRALVRELLAECLADPNGTRPVFSEYGSGQSALRALSSSTPDLVTVDLRMSGMVGTQCVRILRREVPGAMIVVVTSLNGESVARLALQAGADGVVYKDDLTAIQGLVRDRIPALLPSP